ncbi:MAG TPA: aldehyde dehydrogenase family protein, partial [Solirubrobacterales bacterium]|nr:aldehyde dehydrogenase family protein [Solirubrobacterales bacterium]
MTVKQATSTVTSVINGDCDVAETAQVIEARNPSDLEEVLAEIRLATPEGFAQACRAARDGQPQWAATPAPGRGEVIANVAHLVRENKDELAAYMTREVGKTTAEALGEVQEVIDTCEFFLGEGRRLYGMTVPSEMP